MAKKLDKVIHSVVEDMLSPKVWTSTKSIDKGQGSDRSRGSGAKSYPVPWSIEPIEESDKDSKHTGFFVALVLPGDIAEMVTIPGGQPPDDLHVTLFYSKDGTLSQRIKAAEEIRGLLMNVLPLQAKLGGIGRFTGGSTSDGKDVIYLHFDSPQILDYRKAIEEVAMRNGIQVDTTHGFVPHVTIAYVDASEPTPFNRLKQQIELTVTQPKIVLGKPEILDPAMVSEAGPPPIPPQVAMGAGDDNVKQNSVDEKLARIVMKRYAPNMAKRGWVVNPGAPVLGVGSRGAAFDIGNNHVLKITGDEREAMAANRLKGKKNKHVYNVYDVFQIKGLNIFGIIQEKLEQLPGSEGRKPGEYDGPAGALSDAILMTEFPAVVFTASSWDEVLNKMQARANSKLKKMEPDQKKDFKDTFAEAIKIMNFYNLKGMFEELRALGISFRDYHGGNIFRRPGTKEFVIGDIGYSDVKGGQKPDVLEKKLREAEEDQDEFETDYDDMLDVAKENGILLYKKHKINVDTMKSLGSGMMGEAFDIGGGKVLKITKDRTEAIASFSIKGKEFKHLLKVYDVFKFKNRGLYGIVEEKLFKLTSQEAKQVADFSYYCSTYGILDKLQNWKTKEAFETVQRLLKNKPNLEDEFFKVVDDLGVYSWFDDLKKAGIHFIDFHQGNVMKKRDGSFCLIDLGVSITDGGVNPPVLEKKIINTVMETLVEGVADSIGITIGRFQPFHKGHAEIIRNLAKKHNKVIVFIAGLKKDEKNPFSYDLRKEMMLRSLPDIASKIEVYKAEDGGKQTGYLPVLINKIVANHNSSLEPKMTGNIVVGPDRVEDVKKQFDHARTSKEKLDGFDPTLFVIETMPELSNDGDTQRVSGTAVRSVLKAGDKEALKKLLDPHVLSDETYFEEIYDKLRKEAGYEQEAQNESISDLKDGEGSIFRTLEANRERLARKNIKTWTRLGNGQMGTAFDIGSGRVLKVTTDAKEARTSQGLKGKNNQHIVKIFDVFKFDEKIYKDEVPMYGIIQEKLEPLSKQEHDEFNELKDAWWDDRVIDTFATKSFAETVVKMRRVWFEELLRDLGHPVPESMSDKDLEGYLGKVSSMSARLAKAIANAHKHLADNEKLMLKYQVDKIVGELRANGIEFADLKSENLMKKNQNYVVVDLGLSKGANGAEPPVLEQMIINAIKEAGIPASPTDYASPSARVHTSIWSSGNVLEPKEDEIEDDGHEKLQQYSRPPKF